MSSIALEKHPRAYLVDEIRGVALLFIVWYHAVYDLVYIFGVDLAWFRSFTMQEVLQPISGMVFVFIAGLSCRYSRSNWKRGCRILGLGVVFTLFTALFMPSQVIWFGVLSLLGSCMLLFTLFHFLTGNLYETMMRWNAAGIWIAVLFTFLLFAITWKLPEHSIGFFNISLYKLPSTWYQIDWLAFLGFPGSNFYSSDYYPLIPWGFLFASGSYLGIFFVTKRAPSFCYQKHCKPLAWIGRRTLWVYLLHQPILMGIYTLWFSFVR